jgi:hypothetical protein
MPQGVGGAVNDAEQASMAARMGGSWIRRQFQLSNPRQRPI